MSDIHMTPSPRVKETPPFGVECFPVYVVDSSTHLNLDFKVVAHCKDANFAWWPGADCRPHLEVEWINRPGYEYNSLLGLWYVFDVELIENQTKADKHCKVVKVVVNVYSQGNVPLGGAKGPLGLSATIGKPIESNFITSFKVCCDDCKLSCLFDPPEEE